MANGDVIKQKGELWTIRKEFIDSFLVMSNIGFKLNVIPKQRMQLRIVK